MVSCPESIGGSIIGCNRSSQPALRRTVVSFALCALVALQAACSGGGGGGGDGGSDTPPPASGDTTAPSIPDGVTAAAASDSRIDLSWNASTDTGGSNLSGYRIYRDDATTALATVNAPLTSYSDTGLTASTRYSYVVRAFDGAGNESAPPAAVVATTLAAAVPGVSGMDSRPSNTTCVAWARPASGSISLTPFTDLKFASPVAMLQAPHDNARWFVVEQAGAVKQFSGTNPTAPTTFIDITSRVSSGGELGLLGMAFHPNFPTDPRVFLSYTTVASGQRVSHISAFRTTDGGATLDAAGEEILLSVDQPESNHNGGNIAFGPDGFLYIGFGDGGGGGDDHGTDGNGQRLTTLLGKMLRIDVNGAAPYAIPPGNPFASNSRCPAAGRTSGECPEIYAWGFRNPWRWSFDRSNGDLWVGDVGQSAWEEVDRVTLGGNYGWRCREGAHDYNSSGTPACSGASLIDPVAEYSHSLGSSITGGYVYRGSQPTALTGRYLFGDFGSGRIWAWIEESAAQPRQPTQLLDTDRTISSFGQGNDGELYVVDYYGALYRINFQTTSGGSVPTKLSATGCVDPADARKPAAGLIPYDINAPFWSDGASKNRWIGLPEDSKITVGTSGDWDFPSGTVLVKNFSLGTRLVETRLFMRHPDGGWGGFTYEWNAEQTDATLLRDGAVRDIGGQQWIFPSESQCSQCHTSAAGGALGLETAQLNRDLLYPQTSRNANELFTLNHIAVLSPPIPDPATQPRMADPADTTAALGDRARAYLHTNCSQCHRPGGPTPSAMDLRYTTPLGQTGACDAPPQSGDLGLGPSARLIAPGSAATSIVVSRTNRRDANAMPPLASNVVDADGVALLTQWINSLSGC